ncbi:MAG: N-acetyl-D-Glu racemase DgcA [Pseudomonadota bacterium]
MAQSSFKIRARREAYPIDGQFRISRGAKTQADVIVAEISMGRCTGRGECVPYACYGESLDSVQAQITGTLLENTGTIPDARAVLHNRLPPGAARNALDCALWDLQSKSEDLHFYQVIKADPPRPLETAFTLSLDTPEGMADAARGASSRPLLKIKLGGDDDIACMHAVVANAPNSGIIIDANEAWKAEDLPRLMREAAHLDISLIEQPLPAGDDAALAHMPHPVPICADESVHCSKDIAALADRYDYINIKLDKAGGLTEAMKMREEAKRLGFGIMVGCMVGSSLAMAPAFYVAQDADYVDLDGPLLLARDRSPALHYYGNTISPPEPALWG